MKNFLHYLCILAVAVITLNACNNDSNGCPDGYEGANCAEEVREKFVGTYTATWYQIGIDTFDAGFDIEKDVASIEGLILDNLTLTVDNAPANRVLLPLQTLVSPVGVESTWQGQGVLTSNNELRFDLSVTIDGGAPSELIIIGTKQ